MVCNNFNEKKLINYRFKISKSALNTIYDVHKEIHNCPSEISSSGAHCIAILQKLARSIVNNVLYGSIDPATTWPHWTSSIGVSFLGNDHGNIQ